MGVNEAQLTQTADHHLALTAVLVERYGANLFHLNPGIILSHDRSVGSSVGSHTTGVERTQRQLSTRLTDSLCSDDTDSLTLLDHLTGSQVTTVTLHADAMFRLAGEYGTYLDRLNGRILNSLCDGLGNLLTGSNDEFAGRGMDNIVNRDTTQNALIKRRDNLVAILQGGAYQTTQRATVLLVDDDIVRDVDETTCQVTGVGRLHGGVGQTLTGTVGRDEVLQHGHTLLEV